MHHAASPNYAPRSIDRPVTLPPPPPAALNNPAEAEVWFREAVTAAGEILYRDRPGMPRRASHDSQILALAYAAKPTAKGWILALLSAAGRLAHLADDRDLSDGATRLLHRLAALLAPHRCQAGVFRVTACNATLAREMDKTARTIRRHLAELHAAGFIYRHFTTGPIGLDRPAIDLGPLVSRLPELQAAIADRAQFRADLRADRARCATLPPAAGTGMSGGEDIPVPLNTDDLESLADPVIAPEPAGAGEARGQPQPRAPEKPQDQPLGQPGFVPKPHHVLDQCPSLAAYVAAPSPTWRDLINAAFLLASSWDMNAATWKTLCARLGREWAAITIATVAELPAARFTRSRAPRIELKRASYVAGIARKLARGENASIAASWFRHVKRQTLATASAMTN